MSGADTIVALSSGAPPAAIAVLRISGPDALATAAGLAGELPPPRSAALRALKDAGGALLDRALVLVFPGPASATGEDLVELHCHGGRATVAAVEAAVLARGARCAEPGEFTRRALANGRIDLAEAEGLADLLAAETEAQRRAALLAAEGAVSRRLAGWMDALAVLSARVEVAIDYADEGEGAVFDPALPADIDALAAEMAAVLAAPPVERLRDGVRVVIAGPPNAGKSTLLNALAGREVAIVSPIAGTTRDRIEAPVRRAGLALLLADTAGLTDTTDPVEAIGVARARDAIARADVLLWLGEEPPPRADALRIFARADLPGRAAPPAGALAVSARSGQGIAGLWDALAERAGALLPPQDAVSLAAHQRAEVAQAAAGLAAARAAHDPLIAAEELRLARARLAKLLGADATEAMLDRLFARFCLGK